MEKLSEQNLRQEKVNKLKEKIKTQISQAKLTFQKKLQNNTNLCYEYGDEKYNDNLCFILSITALYAIEEFIMNRYSFMTIHATFEKKDVVIYDIPIAYIDYMLEDDSFNFFDAFLCTLDLMGEEDGRGNMYYLWSSYALLDDSLIAHDMIHQIDIDIFHEFQKRKN